MPLKKDQICLNVLILLLYCNIYTFLYIYIYIHIYSFCLHNICVCSVNNYYAYINTNTYNTYFENMYFIKLQIIFLFCKYVNIL